MLPIDESSIQRFRHLLEQLQLAEQILATANDLPRYKGLLLKAGTGVDATLIAAPSRLDRHRSHLP
jgi:IS5 family transposase